VYPLKLPILAGSVVIRLPIVEDGPNWYRIVSDPCYVARIGSPVTRDTFDLRLESWVRDNGSRTRLVLAVADQSSDAMIGECALIDRGNGDVEFVMAVLSEARGQGIGSVAGRAIIQAVLDTMPIARVIAEVEASNSKAHALATAVGFLPSVDVPLRHPSGSRGYARSRVDPGA
jgi:RimJ/RimL family protein N-acetyltransferase